MNKGNNSIIKNGWILPIHNPTTLNTDNNRYAKIKEIPWINTQVIDRKWLTSKDGLRDRFLVTIHATFGVAYNHICGVSFKYSVY